MFKEKQIQIDQVRKEFRERFEQPFITIQSPGRVNIIGEHTDYNDGFVLPAAINKTITVAIASNNSAVVNLYSMDMEQKVQISLDDLSKAPTEQWAKYLYGAVIELKKLGYTISGFDMVFGGNIPIGAGMSSSAALEGGVLTGLNELFDLGMSTKEMALTGQKIEHNHVGVMCGVMDQFINLHGESGKVLKLDCRSLGYELVPYEREDVLIVLCDSKVSHNLASSEYNVRRQQCEEGVSYFQQFDEGIKSLRDISMEMFKEKASGLDPITRKRCKYVIEENARVHTACKDLKKGDFEALGNELLKSHKGLSEEYEVSCDELDLLVELAKDQPGVYGSRMMGGGFGGCTINLVEEAYVSDFRESMIDAYKYRTGIDTEVHIMKIDSGTHIIKDN